MTQSEKLQTQLSLLTGLLRLQGKALKVIIKKDQSSSSSKVNKVMHAVNGGDALILNPDTSFSLDSGYIWYLAVYNILFCKYV